MFSIPNNLSGGGGTPYKGQNPLIPTEEGIVIPKHTLLLQDLAIAGYIAAGQCAWKKTEILTASGTITFTKANSSTTPTLVTVSSNDIDLTKVDASFFVGLSWSNANGTKNTFIDATTINIIGDSDFNYTYDPASMTISIAYDVSYYISDGSCTFSNKQFYGDTYYVVSNDESKYPDGGTQDGYYYKRVTDGIDLLSTCGMGKMAIDKITFSSRTASNTAISHSLGEKPKLAIIIRNGLPTEKYDVFIGVDSNGKYTDPNGVGGFGGFINYLATTTLYQMTHTTGYITAPTTDTVYFYTNSSYFSAGVEYTLITMA